jgi:YD repeat-containing protein
MRKLLIALSAVMVVMSACQKEGSYEDPNGGNGGSGGGGGTNPQGLLTRVVYATSTDSTITDYTYDGAKRLATLTYAASGTTQFTRLTRNASGILTQYTTKSPDLASIGLDSVVTYVGYNTAKSQYAYSLLTVTVSGVTYKDSAAFVYDGSGNIVSKMDYAQAGPSPYQLYAKTDYGYAGGNLVSEKNYSYNGSATPDLDETFTYTYDAKVNPLKVGPEAIVALYDVTYFSNNNVVKVDYVDNADASNNYTLTSTLTYNSANKPSGGTAVESTTSGQYSLRYYYN